MLKNLDLDEPEFRKIVRAFFAEYICDRNIQHYHGVGEHGKDAVGVINSDTDPLGKDEVLFIQIKAGDVSLIDWNRDIAAQMDEMSRSTTLPIGTSRDNCRRLLLIISGELKPETFDSKDWNNTRQIPVEVIDFWGLLKLFGKYNVVSEDFDDLLELADTLGL